MNKKYYIGPAGWSYKDWEGIVYPRNKEKNFHQLKFLSRFFNTVEINSSFYRPPAAKTTQKWVELTAENPDFSFSYKLWQRFTHDRDSFPSAGEEKLVKTGLDPIAEQGKLGALLIQFPWSFKNEPQNREWLDRVLELFNQYHPVIEVRHLSWNSEEFFKYLREKKAGFANIDQPVIGKSLKLSDISTSDVAYLRLHGRNYQNWFKDNAETAARYDYLYNDNELAELSKTISSLIAKSPKTYIIFNNHYRGQAIANAFQTLFLLTDSKLAIPQSLTEYYPNLKTISHIEEQLSIL